MHQCGKTYLSVIAESAGLLQDHHGMNAGVDFAMVFFWLRYAKQIVDFRKYFCQCATASQYLEILFGMLFT